MVLLALMPRMAEAKLSPKGIRDCDLTAPDGVAINFDLGREVDMFEHPADDHDMVAMFATSDPDEPCLWLRFATSDVGAIVGLEIHPDYIEHDLADLLAIWTPRLAWLSCKYAGVSA